MSNTNRWPTDQEIIDHFEEYWSSKDEWYFNEANFSMEEMAMHAHNVAIDWLKSLQDSTPNIGENPVKGAGDECPKGISALEYIRELKSKINSMYERAKEELKSKDEEIQRLTFNLATVEDENEWLKAENSLLKERVRELEKDYNIILHDQRNDLHKDYRPNP